MSLRWVVLKYGGTSVATAERWERIADRIRRLQVDHRVCVVVSALAGVTDSLTKAVEEACAGSTSSIPTEIRARHQALAEEAGLDPSRLSSVDELFEDVQRRLEAIRIIGEAPPKLRARILAAGEMASSRLGAAILAHRGVDARWIDATRVLMSDPRPRESEEDRYLEASVHPERDPERVESEARACGCIITQGFVARTRDGDVCLLGRGGSDASAALLAALLEASRLEIWTDVHGLFTADPGIVPEARLIRRLGYHEAQELAGLGAKVLHPRTIDPVARGEIPLRVLCVDAPEESGTLIEKTKEKHPTVTAVTHRKGVTLVTVSTVAMYGAAGYLARIFAAFEENGFSVDLVATSQTAVTASLDRVPGGVGGRGFTRLKGRLEDLGHVTVIHPCAIVSIVGRRIRAVLHEIGPALEALRERPVHLVSDSSEDLNLSFVVDEHDGPVLVAKLHDRLFSGREGDPNLGPTWESLAAGPLRLGSGEAEQALKLSLAERHDG